LHEAHEKGRCTRQEAAARSVFTQSQALRSRGAAAAQRPSAAASTRTPPLPSALGASGSLTGEHGFDVLTLADGSQRALALLALDGVATLFDIDLATGALAIIESTGAPPSVYAVSLATGAATPFNVTSDIVGHGTLDVRGLALQRR
jgi:hypothetical protein